MQTKATLFFGESGQKQEKQPSRLLFLKEHAKEPTVSTLRAEIRVKGLARLRAERWSALTAPGSHSLPTLQVPYHITKKQIKAPINRSFHLFGAGKGTYEPNVCANNILRRL